MSGFVHLHNHSEYSLLDGASNIEKMVTRAKKLNMSHIAITDHGNLFGAIKFYKACKKQEITPIIGCEFYMAPESRHLRRTGLEKYHHFLLLAKNEIGYRNLMRLSSLGYTEGFYYKPRIDEEILKEYREGLIALSACIAGEIPTLIRNDRITAAKEKIEHYLKLFPKEDFYLELQDHGIPVQKTINQELKELSRIYGVPLVATNDCHYINESDAAAHDILLCIGTGKKLTDEKRLSFDTNEFYIKSRSEMEKVFPDMPEVLDISLVIANKCSLEIPLPGPLLPDYKIPVNFKDPNEYLRHIAEKGLKNRYTHVTETVKKRLDMQRIIKFQSVPVVALVQGLSPPMHSISPI
jgi:DNA polymerase-3 subunit alpha